MRFLPPGAFIASTVLTVVPAVLGTWTKTRSGAWRDPARAARRSAMVAAIRDPSARSERLHRRPPTPPRRSDSEHGLAVGACARCGAAWRAALISRWYR